MTRILLVDDHALFRESLARLLQSETGLEVTGKCGTVEDAVRLLGSQTFDLILLDYDLGDRRGNDIVSFVSQQGIEAAILLVTVGLTKTEFRQMLNHGVKGVFLKNNPPELLVEAIRAVVAGKEWIDPSYSVELPVAADVEPFRKVRFTERDREVLRAVFEGLANKEIAERLTVSESAVKASLQQLFSKTGVRTRSQLVRVALEQYRRELL